MVLTPPYITRLLRRLHTRHAAEPIEEELRGWNWDRPPIKPRAYYGLTMADVVSRYCPTRRDVWLRRVQRAKPVLESRPLVVGKIIHIVFHTTYTLFMEAATRTDDPGEVYDYMIQNARQRLREQGVDIDAERWTWKLYRRLALSLAGSMAVYTAWHPGSRGYEQMTWVTEQHIDGTPLGLSKNLRVDAFNGSVVVEIKYGKPAPWHTLSLAGYAMALEANYETPVDYGLILYINGLPDNHLQITIEPRYLSNTLRRLFLDQRDETIDMLMSEHEPPVPPRGSCPETCPFYTICHGDRR